MIKSLAIMNKTQAASISKLFAKFMLLMCAFCTSLILAQEEYILGPSSAKYEGIAEGKVTKHIWKSTIYPNTIRDYYVYVPSQYDPSEPAALMVFQDGHTYVKEDGDFRVPVVFDNLIAQKKIPVTIGLFINPGHSMDSLAIENPFRASNRSLEYDDMSDTYGRFLIEEMIPELKKEYNISDNPKMRAIGGLSSGAICAFTAAWFFPEHFHKVLSHIGSYTDIRGGHNYPPIIRKTDKKDIKVFLQDGSNDLNNQYGNWYLANLQMESALKFKEYDYKFVEGTEGHNGKHGGAILPQSLLWLWSDVMPNTVAAGVYPFSVANTDSVLLKGETSHFSYSELKVVQLKNDLGTLPLKNDSKEQIFIIKEGEVEVSVKGNTKTIGPNSVVVLMPKDKGTIRSVSDNATYYTMKYESKIAMNLKRGKKDGGSAIIDFDELEFKEHDKGGIRNYFRRSTAMCPYYEMHVTNLNGGIKSHEPHTHFATEIILMVKGNTEMEIGNQRYQAKKGDVYFVPSNVPHAIRNLSDEQCMYFAYQWN